jgi:RNA polymerase sigma-70 factor, ECF subfamily
VAPRYGLRSVDELTQLLRAAQGGDARALARFVERTQPEVWRFCAHLLGRHDADDAAQETYLRAWRALPSFRGESSARTWLFTIARRTVWHMERQHRQWHEGAGQLAGPRPVPDAEGSAHLDQLVRGLDGERRAAFVLTQMMGLSYAETAQVCDCPVGTVRSRVARARAELVAAWYGAEQPASRRSTS